MIALLLVTGLHGVAPLSPLRVVAAYSSIGSGADGTPGVDLGGSPGQQVVSATAGTVTFAGSVAGGGSVGSVGSVGRVTVTLADGRLVTYEPLLVGIAPGSRVAAGEPIGELSPGWPGCPDAACLHWELASGTGATVAYTDPMTLLGPPDVRLLPLTDTPDSSAGDAVGAGPGSDPGSGSTFGSAVSGTVGGTGAGTPWAMSDARSAAGGTPAPASAVGRAVMGVGLGAVVGAGVGAVAAGRLAARRLRRPRRPGPHRPHRPPGRPAG